MSDATSAAATRPPAPMATLVVAVTIVAQPNLGLTPLTAHDDQRVLQVGALAMVTLWIVLSPDLRQRMADVVATHARAWSAVAVAGTLGLVSSALAVDPWTGVLEVALLTALVIVVIAVAAETAAEPARTTQRILVAVTAAAALQLVALVGADLADGTEELWSRGGLRGGFSHPRFLNQFQAMALPLLGAVCASDDRRIRYPAMLVTAMTAWSLVLTEGRGAVLAVVTVLVVVAVTGGDGGRRWARALGVPAGVGAVVALVTRPLLGISGLLVSDDIASSSGRTRIWAHAWSQATEHPALGIGPGHIAHLEVVPRSDLVPAHPHNAVLQLVAEWGFPAAMLLVGAVVAAGLAVARRPAPASRGPRGIDGTVVTAGTSAAVGAGLLVSLVSGVIVMPTAQLLLAAVGGLALGQRLATREPSQPARRRVKTLPAALLAVAMLAVVGLVAEVGPTPVADRRADAQAFFAEFGEDTKFDPRFWVQGLRGWQD